MADKKKCAWYAEFEGVCTNGDCPCCADDCPVSGELGVCRFDKDNNVPGKVKGVENDPVRYKLIELIGRARTAMWGKTIPDIPTEDAFIADHLIANGVTVQKWIPVTEGLPKLIPCNAGTAYSEAVNVLTSGRKVLTAIWDGTDFIADAEFWEAEGEEITHWTPVLLPLPEPPKGE